MNNPTAQDLASSQEDMSLLVQLARYFVVGLVAFGADFSTLFIMTGMLGVNYLVSAAIAFLIGLIVNYALAVKFVFQGGLANKKAEFLFYGIIGLIGLGINEILMWSLTEFAGFYYLVSKLFSTMTVFCFNFFARKLLLFRSGK